MDKAKATCQKTVYPREKWGAFHGSPCGKPAALEYGGKWYCKHHHPPTIEARRLARIAKSRLCALCSTIVPADIKYCRFHATESIGRDQLAELRKDEARLDWLDRHAHCCDQFGSGSDDYWWSVVYNDGHHAEGHNPRAAIDAAMERP